RAGESERKYPTSPIRAQKSHAQHLLFDDSTPLDPSTLTEADSKSTGPGAWNHQKSHAQHLLFDDSTPLDPSTLNQLLSTPSTSIKSAGHSGLHLRRHRVLRLIL